MDVTPISSLTKEYIPGLKTPATGQFTFNHIPGNADYAAFLALVDAGTILTMQVRYLSGDIATFSVVLLGRNMESPDGSSQLKMVVNYQQSGDPVWTEAP